jgi:hypothetical protein
VFGTRDHRAMAPPTGTEQLIRDYLNRMSVAARDLAADDRRALLERVRRHIEQRADLAKRPTTMDVGRVLARLGDPAALVERERRRLAAQGKSARPAESAEPVRQRLLSRMRGRELGRPRGLSFRWSSPRDDGAGGGTGPAAPNGVANHHDRSTQTDTQVAPAAASESAGSAPSANGTAQATQPPPTSPAQSFSPPGPPAAEPRPQPPPQRAPAAGDHAAHDSGAIRQPADTGRPSTPSAGTTGGLRADSPSADAGPRTAAPSPARSAGSPGATGTRSRDESGPTAAAAAADVSEPAGNGGQRTAAAAASAESARDGAAPEFATPADVVRQQLGRLVGWVRRRPLEAAAIALMGIGGPIFPPVFLLGATLALASELWDGRDKWVGLALPVVATIVSLAVGIAAGGRAHWAHEAWVYVDVVSRVAPVLGAAYLAWRAEHVRRPPPVPPFSRPRATS